MKDPVCLLLKNLYGHPRAGNGWERHLTGIVEKHGFVAVPEWPSVFYNEDLDVMLVVYVDDLLGSGRDTDVRKALKALRADVEFDEPEVVNKYLGCRHSFEEKGDVKTCVFNMISYCQTACNEFADERGHKFKSAPTPYAPELPRGQVEELEAQPGVYADSCAHHLMKLLYAARQAKLEVIVAITRLASKITKWWANCDRKLVRLFDFLNTNSNWCTLRFGVGQMGICLVTQVSPPKVHLVGILN